ncbi:hypothetical protein BLNAU_22713 [Blattamonas nauphoetae]|uniref:Uncharacterized protein n=1 Tax=Blattamonas nauphoetae TaxID=2049346 RepID=A0ABQ9WWF9_9EUKA|nr:hypothetical protein BLNAU_22713 [Blattamonas nauphoetae]
MGQIINKPNNSPGSTRSSVSSPQLSLSTDSSAFLNWDEEELESNRERVILFRSLVATMKLQPALDDSLKRKAVEILVCIDHQSLFSADIFLTNFGHITDESLTKFVQSMVVLISSPNQSIITAAMKMLNSLMVNCLERIRLALVKADIIPQLINTLNPLTLSFAEGVDIHINLIKSITNALWLATPDGLASLEIEDHDGQQAVHETVLKQVLSPLEKYIWRLCMNRYSIIDSEQSENFLELLAQLLRICPYYQPTMEFVLHMPVFLTIPSCLTFFEKDSSIYWFLYAMINSQRKWNEEGGEVRHMRKNVLRMLRMKGIEDVMEEKLKNDRHSNFWGDIVDKTIEWNNLQGMNLSKQE